LLIEKFSVHKDYIVELEENKTYFIPLEETKKEVMHLTLIDANHCPGSVMFLMEGYFGVHLHTGDFRYDSKMLEIEILKNKKIDVLYLDDTFSEKCYNFKTRKEAGEEILEICKKQSEETRIFITTDTLGKEELLLAVAMSLKSMIVCDEERLASINIIRRHLDIPEIFTTKEVGRIFIVPKKGVFKRVINERKEQPTIGILASGWSESNNSISKEFKDSYFYKIGKY
jgi:DNA cross-link repair 1B protein